MHQTPAGQTTGFQILILALYLILFSLYYEQPDSIWFPTNLQPVTAKHSTEPSQRQWWKALPPPERWTAAVAILSAPPEIAITPRRTEQDEYGPLLLADTVCGFVVVAIIHAGSQVLH